MSNKHRANKHTKFVKQLEKNGFTISKKTNNKFCIFKGNGPSYTTHVGPKAFHPIRRFLKNKYGVII